MAEESGKPVFKSSSDDSVCLCARVCACERERDRENMNISKQNTSKLCYLSAPGKSLRLYKLSHKICSTVEGDPNTEKIIKREKQKATKGNFF